MQGPQKIQQLFGVSRDIHQFAYYHCQYPRYRSAATGDVWWGKVGGGWLFVCCALLLGKALCVPNKIGEVHSLGKSRLSRSQ